MLLYTVNMQVSVIQRTAVNIYAETLQEAKAKVKKMFGFNIISGKEATVQPKR